MVQHCDRIAFILIVSALFAFIVKNEFPLFVNTDVRFILIMFIFVVTVLIVNCLIEISKEKVRNNKH